MPTRKLEEWEMPKQCNDPDHDVPTMQYFPPGTYEHECPKCGKKTQFTIRGLRY